MACLNIRACPRRLTALSILLLVMVVALLDFYGAKEKIEAPFAESLGWSAPDVSVQIPSAPVECSQRQPESTNDSEDTATAVSPMDLLCRKTGTRTGSIPKLIHQSWKTSELPSKFQVWSDGCRRLHPGWEWVLWTDTDNDALVKMYFPWLEDTYLSLPGPIYRADLARNLYMYMFGGVYADLDTKCLRPTESALQPYRIQIANETAPSLDVSPGPDPRVQAVFGRLGSDPSFKHSIPNAWMAATPRHDFFMLPLRFAQAEVKRANAFPRKLWYWMGSAEEVTGPIALRKCVLRWKTSLRDLWSEIVLLPSEMIYPFSWKTPGKAGHICSTMSRKFDEELCKDKLRVKEKGSLTVTFWSHTHDGDGADEERIKAIDNVESADLHDLSNFCAILTNKRIENLYAYR